MGQRNHCRNPSLYAPEQNDARQVPLRSAQRYLK